MQRIVPHLWFDKEAREAATFYTTLFGGDSQILHASQLHDTPSGSVDVVSFSLWGYEFASISAGPLFKFSPAISISVQGHDKEEVGRLYEALAKDGTVRMELGAYPWSDAYAWVDDRYGLSWQLNLPKDQGAINDRIYPAFTFVGNVAGKAEDAMQKYTAIFPNSSMTVYARYGTDAAGDKEGTILHAEFTLADQTFMAMDSAHPHEFSFTEAFSLMVRCKDQKEIDYYWDQLSAVPEAEQCGWLKDEYGVSWQIVPTEMDEMMQKGTPEQIARVTAAFLQMKKFDLATLRKAYAG